MDKKTKQEKRNKKASYSQDAIRQSMIKLMKSAPYSEITVSMIASDACINRKTFYAHYPNKDKLLFALLYEMLDDLFGCFMYRKDPPADLLDEVKLREDAQNFLRKIICYEERIPALITDETLVFSRSVADQVLLDYCKDITFLNETENTIFRKLHLEMMRSFFMGMISACIDSEKKSFDETVDVLVHLMKHSYADIFSYTQSMPEP